MAGCGKRIPTKSPAPFPAQKEGEKEGRSRNNLCFGSLAAQLRAGEGARIASVGVGGIPLRFRTEPESRPMLLPRKADTLPEGGWWCFYTARSDDTDVCTKTGGEGG